VDRWRRRPELIAESTSAAGPLGWIGAKGDPFFAVVAERPPAAAVAERTGA